MNYRDKTKSELIKELLNLQKEHDSLKTSSEKDISGLKRAEENLHEIAMKLARSQKIGKLGSWEWNMVDNTLEWSDEVYQIWGVGKDFALSFESINQMIHPDDREFNLKMVQKFLADTNNGEFEFRIICPDGTIKNIFQSIETSSAPSGQPLRMFGIMQDITGRKRIEEVLRSEKENFRHSLEDSPLGNRIATIEGKTIYANKALLFIYGYDNLEELQKTPLRERYTQESYILAQERKQRRQQGDLSDINYEVSIIRKNGEIRHLQAFRKEILWDGVRQSQVIYNDITELKHDEEALRESEARFRTLFETSLLGISIAKPGGGLLHVNNAYARMYGYENPEILFSEVSDTSVLFANPEERKEVLRELQRNGFMEPKEFELIRRDGSHFFVMVSAGEIRDSEGKLLYNQATHIDLTDRKKMEEELRNSKELLERLNIHQTEIREEERAKISREIHDQLGQSMTALKLDLNRMHKYINTNPEAVTKLESMIELVSDTIKDVQRISSDLRPGILDELGLVSAIEWYCDEFEQRTGIKCTLKLEDSNYKDPQINLAFFRILQETLTNVIRHAKASRVSIKLNQSKKGATMTIQDNGIGLPVEMIGSLKSLGLISMRERAKQFNGTIDISAKENNGTKLNIFIPF